MKKTLIIAVLVLTVLAVPAAAFARGPGNGDGTGMMGNSVSCPYYGSSQGPMGDPESCPYYGTNQGTLSEDQQAERMTYFLNRMEEKKALINERLAAGTITQEQADAALQRIETMIQFRTENGFQAMGLCQGLAQGLGQGQGQNGQSGQGMMQGRGMRGQGNGDGWGFNLGWPGFCLNNN